MSSSSPPASLLATAPSRVHPQSPSSPSDARPDVQKHTQPRMHESTASTHSSFTFSSPHRPSAPDTVACPSAHPLRTTGMRAPPIPISTTMHQQHSHTSQPNVVHSPAHNQHDTPSPPAFAHHHSLVTPSMPTSPLFRTALSPGTGPIESTGTGSGSGSGSGSGPGLGSSGTGAAGGSFFPNYLHHHHPHAVPQGSSSSRQSRPTSFTSSSPLSPSILSLAAGTSYTSAHVSSAFFRTMVRPDTDTTAPALVDMEGIDMSDDEQNYPDPGTRIDRQSVKGIDDSDESGESSDGETGSADGEDDQEDDGAEEVEDIVGRTTVVPGSAASILSTSVSSPSMVTARLGIFNAFKHNSSGDFFQSLGRRSEERTRHGLETPVVQPLDRDFTEQQQQQQQQHALPNVERERVAAVVDQDLQGDALQHAVTETISGIEATADQVPQDDSLPQTESEESHLGSVETGDRPLTETIQPMEAHDLIDEGVFYETEKVDRDMDTSLAYLVSHHPQPEEEEEDASRNELVQESRMLTDIEDPSEHWKGDPLQHLESEIPMLELTLSPPIEPYRVLRRQSSVEDFVDAAPPRKTRVAKNAAFTSSLDRKETQGLRNLPVARPMSRRRHIDQDNSSSSRDDGGGGGGQLGYELLYPRFTSLKSSLVAASARVVSFSLLHRSDSASSPSTFASAEDVGTEQLSTGTGTGSKQELQETSVIPSSSPSLSSQGMSTATSTSTATTATLATELGHLQTSVSSLHQRLDRIEQALDVSSRRRTDLGRRTVLGVVRMVVKQGVMSAVIILVVFVVLYRRRSPVAMVVMAHVQRRLRLAMGIGGAVQQGGGWKAGAGGARQRRWRTLLARLM